MPDREKVIKAWECCNPFNRECNECPYEKDCYHDGISRHMVADAIVLLKEQEEIINELLGLGYPHNFQHEAPWVVDYLYSLTEIIKKAFKAKEGR